MPTALYGRGKPPAISHPPNLAAARFAVVRFAAHVTESNISDRTSFLLSIRLSGFRPRLDGYLFGNAKRYQKHFPQTPERLGAGLKSWLLSKCLQNY